MKIFLFYFTFLSFTFLATAQEAQVDSTATQSKTIVENYQELIEESGNWQDYRLIKKEEVAAFENKLKEAKDAYESEITSLESNIINQNKEIKDLKQELASTQNSLEIVQDEKDSMQIFGNNLNKAAYQTIVFSIIGILILILIILLIKFKSNSQATKDAKEILNRTEQDFEDYKRKALEKQQKLGRELQDEKNKVNKLKPGGKK